MENSPLENPPLPAARLEWELEAPWGRLAAWSGEPLARFELTPRDPVRGRVLLLHGLCEHAFRMLDMAAWCARHGLAATLWHLSGHGTPPTASPDSGASANGPGTSQFGERALATAYWKETAGAPRAALLHDGLALQDPAACLRWWQRLARLRFEALESELRAAMCAACPARPPTPVFIAGHSLGGLLAARAVVLHAARNLVHPLAGLVLLSPALAPRARGAGGWLVEASWRARRAPVVARARQALDRWSHHLPTVDVSWASTHVSDAAVEQELHRQDPLVQRRVPLAFLNEIERAMAELAAAPLEALPPTFLATSATDPIVQTGGAQHFAARAGAARVGLDLYLAPDAPPVHDLWRATPGDALRTRLAAWCEDRLAALA